MADSSEDVDIITASVCFVDEIVDSNKETSSTASCRENNK